MSGARDSLGLLERAALADEVAAALRHDLRNKLGSIRNASFFLARKTKDTEVWADAKVERFFAIIDESVDQADEIISRNFSVGVRARRHLRRVSVRECIDLATSQARVLAGITFELEVVPCDVEVDPDELALAVRCLIENAAEAMEQRGVVRVAASIEKGSCVIAVTDSGPGISEVERDNVFLPHQSTKEGHLGLGLNVARRIAMRYGGALSLVPVLHGAAVSLSLRAANVRPSEPSP